VRTDRKVVIALVLFMGIMGALWAGGPIFFADKDDPTAIDYYKVREVVDASCTQLRADLSAIPADGATADRAEAENRAVEAFTGRIRALGPDTLAKDQPVERWLGDWDQIVADRRQAVRNGTEFRPRVIDGAPIHVRMFALVRAGLRHCDVPPALLSPEPGRV
jgi:hypothetical protein